MDEFVTIGNRLLRILQQNELANNTNAIFKKSYCRYSINELSLFFLWMLIGKCQDRLGSLWEQKAYRVFPGRIPMCQKCTQDLHDVCHIENIIMITKVHHSVYYENYTNPAVTLTIAK